MEKMESEVVDSAWRILQGVRPALPRRENLAAELATADAAQARGYYLPDEDERLREVYRQYLGARSTLWQMVRNLQPHLKGEDLRVFGLAFCAASMLMRSASFVIDLAKERPVVWAKLDEAEPRFGLPRKTFTKIYRSLSSPNWMWQYRQAEKYYEAHRASIHHALAESGYEELIPWLEEEEPYFDTRKRSLWAAVINYRLYSFNRRTNSGYTKVMFHLFRLSGSAIAEMKQPFVKPPGSGKRVTDEVREEVQGLLKPGDVFVTRHDDALSNLFLPGFWPHAALYIGRPDERRDLGVPDKGDDFVTVLEAKKDGVKLRRLRETLAVDAFVILRPQVSRAELKEALTRALSHEGKLYDFIFDFRKSERLACSEVVYRSFHGIGPWQLELTKHSGHHALSAEDLMQQGLEKGLFEVVLIFGVNNSPLKTGAEAARILRKTLRD
ncbi:MAG: YiiX/YebB-like N1pC/P60 family cysteine hydrolase [Akkermansiaceae bacterium]